MRTVIVVFGAATRQGGRLSEPLKRRLQRAREEAHKHPEAPIIVSGGAVKGPAEGPVMRRWLTRHGVDADRIIVEDQARYTLDNAQRVVPLLRKLAPSNVVLVTSASHMARAFALLDAELKSTQQRIVRIHPAAAPESGTRAEIGARYALEAMKTERDLATQKREHAQRFRPLHPRLLGYTPHVVG